jgi:hypothetical protein
MDYSAAVSAITNGELDNCKQEYGIDPVGFRDRVLLSRNIPDRDAIVAALEAEFAAEAAARNGE